MSKDFNEDDLIWMSDRERAAYLAEKLGAPAPTWDDKPQRQTDWERTRASTNAIWDALPDDDEDEVKDTKPASSKPTKTHQSTRFLTGSSMATKQQLANDPNLWLIEDYLLRGSTLILTGNGGSGKMTWFRQFAALGACGINPLNPSVKLSKPLRTLIYDCQDSKTVNAFNWAPIEQAIGAKIGPAATSQMMDSNIWLEIFTGGMDLCDTLTFLTLEDHVSRFKPDLLIIGPVYRAFADSGKVNSSEAVRTLTSSFDGLIERQGISIFLEAHPPGMLADGAQKLAPAGSSIWERWAHNGLNLFTEHKGNSGRFARMRSFREERLGDTGGIPTYWQSDGDLLWNPTTKIEYEVKLKNAQKADAIDVTTDWVDRLRVMLTQAPSHTMAVKELDAEMAASGCTARMLKEAKRILKPEVSASHSSAGPIAWTLKPRTNFNVV